MRIFYIDPQSYNNLSTYDLSLLKNVHGHDITYYYCDQYQLNELPGNRHKCYFHYNKKNNSIAKGLSYTWSILRIIRDVIVHKPDAIHIQWLRLWYIDYAFALLMHKIGIRLIFTAHNILPHVIKTNDQKHYKKYYELVDDIIVHNNRTRKEMAKLMELDENKIKVIFHGVFHTDMPKFEIEQRANELKKRLDIKPSDIVFSCLGVQKPYKGTQLVVETWAENPELNKNPNLHLLIVGRMHGIDLTPIEHIKNVYILDKMISDLDFEAFLHLSSVILLPYLRISQSGLLFSSVKHNTPILVSDVGGLTEPLIFGKIGWNIGSPKKENLQNHMLNLIRTPNKIKEIKGNHEEFEKVSTAYSWESIGTQTAQLYSHIYSPKNN